MGPAGSWGGATMPISSPITKDADLDRADGGLDRLVQPVKFESRVRAERRQVAEKLRRRDEEVQEFLVEVSYLEEAAGVSARG